MAHLQSFRALQLEGIMDRFVQETSCEGLLEGALEGGKGSPDGGKASPDGGKEGSVGDRDGGIH